MKVTWKTHVPTLAKTILENKGRRELNAPRY